jgi:hypothetical protein
LMIIFIDIVLHGKWMFPCTNWLWKPE